MRLPSSFLCPLSGQLMTDPVIAADGKTYQQTGMQNRFSAGNTTSPFDGKLLESLELIPNHELAADIEEWEDDFLISLPRTAFRTDSAYPDQCDCQCYTSGQLKFSDEPSLYPVQVLKVPAERIQLSAVDLLRIGRHPYLIRTRGICKDREETLLATELAPHGTLLDALVTQNERNRQAVSWNHRVFMIQQICTALHFLEQTSNIHSCLNYSNIHLFSFHEDNPEKTLVKLSGYAIKPCSHESNSQISWISRNSLPEEPWNEGMRVIIFGKLALQIVSIGTFEGDIAANMEERRIEENSCMLAKVNMPAGCPVSLWRIIRQCFNTDSSQRPSFAQLSDKLLGVHDGEGTRQPVSRMLDIAVKSLIGKFSFIRVRPEASIRKVKETINERLGIEPTQQRLIYNGKLLDDVHSLQVYCCHSGSVVFLVLRLRCVAAKHPATFGQYKFIQHDARLVENNSMKDRDKLRAHEVVKREIGSLHVLPCLSKARILPLRFCKSLTKYLDGYSRAFPTKKDLTLSLQRDGLIEIIGEQAMLALENYFNASYDVVRLRRTVASDSWIPFHLDDSRRTMQVALNSEDDIAGGELVFATRNGFLEPTRQAGFATIHSSFMVHGVTKLRRGVRYALFLCDMEGHFERSTIRYLIEASRKQLKFYEVAIEFLAGLHDEEIRGYILEYIYFMEHERTEAPSFGVEFIWRCHLLSPICYREFCETLLTQNKTVAFVDHIPRDPLSYDMRKSVVPSLQSTPRMAVDLVSAVRRQREFMKQVVSTRTVEKSQRYFAGAVSGYYNFLRCIGENNTNIEPSLMIDHVWHTHMLFPKRYEEECHLIVGRLIDHKVS